MKTLHRSLGWLMLATAIFLLLGWHAMQPAEMGEEWYTKSPDGTTPFIPKGSGEVKPYIPYQPPLRDGKVDHL